jgi:hypothetical protein
MIVPLRKITSAPAALAFRPDIIAVTAAPAATVRAINSRRFEAAFQGLNVTLSAISELMHDRHIGFSWDGDLCAHRG